MLPELQHTEDFETARRVAFMLATAVESLDLPASRVPHMPLQSILLAVLDGAMNEPAKVDPRTYRVAYVLAGASQW